MHEVKSPPVPAPIFSGALRQIEGVASYHLPEQRLRFGVDVGDVVQVGVVLLASLIPLALDMLSPGKELERKGVFQAILASSSCVLAGALFLRAVIVVGGQM